MPSGKPRGRPKKVPTEPPKITCLCCGNANQANFYVSKDKWRKHYGKVPYCKNCLNEIFQDYLTKYNHSYNLALYYTLRKADLPYIHSVYLGAVQNVQNPGSRIQGLNNLLGAYLKNLAFSEANGWGNTFDESSGEASISGLSTYDAVIKIQRPAKQVLSSSNEFDEIEIDADELVQKWGNFPDEDLAWLESEYMDWEDQLNGIPDKLIDIMVRQICLQLNEIRHDRENNSPVEKKIASLRTLIKDSGISALQDNEAATQGVGMTVRDIEFHRPVKKVDPELEDVDNMRMILDAFLGGTSRAMGKENEFTERFDEEYGKYTIDIIDKLKKEHGLNPGESK